MATHHTALVYTMVLVSAADGEMSDPELAAIGEIVRTLPVFKDYDTDHLPETAADCAELLGEDDGLETVLGLIAEWLPAKLRETSYHLACEVAAADLSADQEELRLLEMLRDQLDIDRLAAAAIERGSRARHATL
ncbi:MAG: tellurite resistance TerB family protein [Proteobacteria bacterium]|nr:tellurite resistance TerB family protein [Pseudomonadota bacterium]